MPHASSLSPLSSVVPLRIAQANQPGSHVNHNPQGFADLTSGTRRRVGNGSLISRSRPETSAKAQQPENSPKSGLETLAALTTDRRNISAVKTPTARDFSRAVDYQMVGGSEKTLLTEAVCEFIIFSNLFVTRIPKDCCHDKFLAQ